MHLSSFLAATGVLTSAVLATPTQQQVLGLELGQLPLSHPDFDLDLNARRLVQFGEDEEPVWVTELEKIQAKAEGRKFFDITDHPDFISSNWARTKTASFPPLNASDAVFEAIALLDIDQPERNLKTFSSFRTRYYRSETGKQSQKWLFAKISDITSEYASDDMRTRIDISEFSHSWGQSTIIVKIKGSSPAGSVIISAHQDSTNIWPFLPAPGADDDGSGTVTILEAYRVLLSVGFEPVNDIEFHWYSAEEGGLLGSQAVASEYRANGASVLAQIQFDMTAYVRPGTHEEVGVITDFVDPGVVAFVKNLIDAYLDIPYVETLCKYACSDHASWTKAGYPSSFAIESSFENSNQNIHTAADRTDVAGFSFTHLLEFSKLALGFAIELADYKPEH